MMGGWWTKYRFITPDCYGRDGGFKVRTRHSRMTTDARVAFYRGFKQKCGDIAKRLGDKDPLLRKYLRETVEALNIIQKGRAVDTGLSDLGKAEKKLFEYLDYLERKRGYGAL